jgi:hypothetical protein
MNADRFKYSNYSGARSQNKKETCVGYGNTLELMFQLEEVSKKLTAHAASILDSGS